MALQDEQSWVTWLSGLGFSDQEMETYSAALASEAITEEDLPELSHDLLKSCNVLKYGHRTKMIRKATRHSSKNVNDHQQSSENYSVVNKATAIPRPTLEKGVTQLAFEQFIYEWKQYRKHYNFQDTVEIETQLTFCCSKDIRARIREGKIHQQTYSEDELIAVIRDIALSRVSRMTHIKKFSLMKQEELESCEDFYGRLQTMATCCQFRCKHCKQTNAKERIREKFILGIKDQRLQTAILRTETHQPETSLEKLVEEAITLEQSIREQKSISSNSIIETTDEIQHLGEDSDVEQPSANSLNFRSSKKTKQVSKKTFPQCSRCGTNSHSIYTTSEKCAAWGQSCRKCGGRNHFAKVC